MAKCVLRLTRVIATVSLPNGRSSASQRTFRTLEEAQTWCRNFEASTKDLWKHVNDIRVSFLLEET
jgi:viroplasmin and RNaseH domain-containing protein